MPYGIGIAKGMLVTLINLVRKPVTTQYPEERLPQHPRFRGENFVWYEERCTGCASCAKYCPLGIIKIVTSPSSNQSDEGERYTVDVFDIDVARCMVCGLCVEACPYDALHMGSGFELAKETRLDLVLPMDELKRAPKKPSAWFRPQIEKQGYDPTTDSALTWREVGRENEVAPSYDDMVKRWVKER